MPCGPLAFGELEMLLFPPLLAPSSPASGKFSRQIPCIINCPGLGNSLVLALSIQSSSVFPGLETGVIASHPLRPHPAFSLSSICHSKNTFLLEPPVFGTFGLEIKASGMS